MIGFAQEILLVIIGGEVLSRGSLASLSASLVLFIKYHNTKLILTEFDVIREANRGEILRNT